MADAVFPRLVYGFHPYGLPEGGTPRDIAAITRDDLVAFHRRYFVPNNAILAVVGDVTAEEAFEGVEGVFGDWAARAMSRLGPSVKPPEPTRRVIVVNKPDAVQTEVRVGHLGVRRSHEDFMSLNLPSASWAAKAPTGCIRYCAPSVGSPTARRRTCTRSRTPATSKPRRTRDPRRRRKCCG